MQKSSGDMRQNAENCAEKAEQAITAPEKARFKRMEKAWDSLANTQDWLDGQSHVPKTDER